MAGLDQKLSPLRREVHRVAAGICSGPIFDRPQGFIVLCPRHDAEPNPKIVMPDGRARVEVELIAHRGL
jgi:hypothetical protein